MVGLDAEAVGGVEDVTVGYTVLPCQPQDALEAVDMEGLNEPNMVPMWGPCFGAIEESREAHGSVGPDPAQWN